MDINQISKSVPLDLTSIDGNAYSLLGHFREAARGEGWSKEEIDCVLEEAMDGNYEHLVATLSTFCNG